MKAVISSRENLEKKFGENFKGIEDKIREYCAVSDGRILYVNKNSGAIDVKKFIDAEGSLFNSFLIIGSNDVIPFFELTNPAADDGDAVVQSDNPYASSDDDYFIPERSFGRIPDGGEARFLIRTLDNMINFYKNKAKLRYNFGLTAYEWIKASREVYKSVNSKTLIISPPANKDNLQKKKTNKKRFYYFNLHGSEKTENWYGQKGNIYPVAFSPGNLKDSEVKGGVIFSEACYGANIINKNPGNAISLKFLEKGAVCFVGSTKIAYGPSDPPSTEADLLGKLFLTNVKNHIKFGESLMKAKQEFAAECVKKGYIDATEKKTLIEFVLYGDPDLNI